jgi:hypothetical protein
MLREQVRHTHAFAGVVLSWLKMGFPCPNAEGGVDVAVDQFFLFKYCYSFSLNSI